MFHKNIFILSKSFQYSKYTHIYYLNYNFSNVNEDSTSQSFSGTVKFLRFNTLHNYNALSY